MEVTGQCKHNELDLLVAVVSLQHSPATLRLEMFVGRHDEFTSLVQQKMSDDLSPLRKAMLDQGVHARKLQETRWFTSYCCLSG